MRVTFRELLGARIKELRLSKNMSQRQLGKNLGVGNSTISSIERGTRNMTVQMLERIAEALDIDMLDLVAFKDEFNIPDIIKETTEHYDSIPNIYIKIFMVCYEQGLRFNYKEDYYYLYLFMKSLNT
jgi:transcriptional regulator with XRE-family HTH domain